MTKSQALERARALHPCAPGEEPTGATQRWMEIAEDPSQEGPIRDVLCWVVEVSGDFGPVCDLVIEDANGALVKTTSYG